MAPDVAVPGVRTACWARHANGGPVTSLPLGFSGYSDLKLDLDLSYRKLNLLITGSRHRLAQLRAQGVNGIS